jgi:hypothetical protein
VNKATQSIYLVLLGLLGLAAGCSKDSVVNAPGGPLVIQGQITDGSAPLPMARVSAYSASDSSTDTTDATGNYDLELGSIVDSVELCVSADGFLDTCAYFLLPPETLRVDLALSGMPHDTVWLTADTVLPGDTAEVVLNLSNPDSAVAGLNVWIRSPRSGITFDTVFLTSPRFPVSGMEWSVARHDSINTIAILMVDFQGVVSIPPGRGPLMRLRYTVAGTQAPGSFALDTTSAVVARPIDISYTSGLSAPGAVFVPGRVVVQ